MIRNDKYYYKTYDVFDESFRDQYRYDSLNPFGYNLESNNRKEKDEDINYLKSTNNYFDSHNIFYKK